MSQFCILEQGGEENKGVGGKKSQERSMMVGERLREGGWGKEGSEKEQGAGNEEGKFREQKL